MIHRFQCLWEGQLVLHKLVYTYNVHLGTQYAPSTPSQMYLFFAIFILLVQDSVEVTESEIREGVGGGLRLEGTRMTLLGMRTSIQHNFCHTVRQ